jgi:hypothetical protein
MAGSLPTCALALLAGLSPGGPPAATKGNAAHARRAPRHLEGRMERRGVPDNLWPRGVYGAHLSDCGGVCYTGSWWVARDVLWVRESAPWPVEGAYLYAFTGVVTRDLRRGSVGGRFVGRRAMESVDDPPPYDVELVLLERKGGR